MSNQNNVLQLLTPTNYHSWSQSMVVTFRQKGFSRFIEHATFQDWWDEDHEEEEQELRYHRRVEEVRTSGRSDQEKDAEYEKIDTLFHSDLGRWSASKAKAKVEHKKEEEMARGLIQSAVSEPFKLKLKDVRSAFDMWAILKRESQANMKHVALLLVRQLVDCRLQSGEKLIAYLGRYEVILDKLRDASEMFVFPMVLQCFLIVSALPPEYDMLGQQLGQLDEDQINLDVVRAKFAAEDSRREARSQQLRESKGSKEERSEEANQAQSERRKCVDCETLLPKDSPRRFKRCGKCHSTFLNAKEKAEEKKETKERGGREEKAHSVVLVGNAMLSASTSDTAGWVMDSGATTHLTNDANDLTNSRESAVSILGPVGERTTAALEGTVFLEVSDGLDTHSIELQDALFSPDLRRKLLSVARLTKSGKVFVLFTSNECLVIDGDFRFTGSVLLKGKLDESGLYVMSESLEEVVALNAAPQSLSLAEWHVKLGHMSKDDIIRASKYYGFSVSDPSCELSCNTCAKATIRRTNFTKKPVNEDLKPGDEIHSDLCGQIVPTSLGGKKYFVTFIDKESDFVFGKTIARKSEVMDEFVAVRAYIQTQLENRMKRFVSDGEGKYVSGEFQSYLRRKGVVHEQTPPYTPQRNPISERKNLTIMNRVRAVLNEKKVPSFLWGEAFNYVLFVMNRAVRKGEEMSRYEKLHGVKPSMKHVHEFATPVVFKDNSNDRKKLDAKGVDGLYVGYNESANTYRIYDIKKRRIVASRDVIFFPNLQHSLEESSEIEIVQEDGEFVWIDADALPVDDENEDFVDFHPPVPPEQLQQAPDPVPVLLDPVLDLIDPLPVVQQQQQEDVMRIGDSRYPARDRKQVVFFNAELVSPSLPDPLSYAEAMAAPDRDQWKEAMKVELDALAVMETWDASAVKPSHTPVVDSKWVFRRKFRPDGSIEKYKARLVAKGFTQTYGVDYDETFAPVARFESIRYVVSMAAASPDLEVHHLDVNSAFLNSSLEEVIFMRLPPDVGGHVVQLRKTLYGLKQSPRCWNKDVTSYLLSLGFVQSDADPCVFISRAGSSLRVIVLWVDDCFVLGSTTEVVALKKELQAKYRMKDFGHLSHFVGLEFEKVENGIKMHQASYLSRVLERFGVSEAKGLDTPSLINEKDHPSAGIKFDNVNLYRQAVGCINYLVTGSRPDIAYSVSVVSRNLSSPSALDWINVRRILCYLKRTEKAGILYSSSGTQLLGFSDASYAEDAKDRKSTGGYVFLLNGGAVSWKAKKQPIVALSSAEAELIALSKAVQESVWLGKLESNLGVGSLPRVIFEDNQSTIRLTKDYVYSDRSKHIDVRYFFARERVMAGELSVQYCPTSEMVADIFTKCLGKFLHYKHAASMGMIGFTQ